MTKELNIKNLEQAIMEMKRKFPLKGKFGIDIKKAHHYIVPTKQGNIFIVSEGDCPSVIRLKKEFKEEP